MRAEPDGLGRGHGAVDAELADLVRRGADDPAALRIAADDHGLAPQLRMVELLDGGVKSVHIHVNDLARLSHKLPAIDHAPPGWQAEHNGLRTDYRSQAADGQGGRAMDGMDGVDTVDGVSAAAIKPFCRLRA